MQIFIQPNLSNSEGVIILTHGLILLLLVIFVASEFEAIGKRFLILNTSFVAEIMQIEVMQLFVIFHVLTKISEYRFSTRQVHSDTSENVLYQLVLITRGRICTQRFFEVELRKPLHQVFQFHLTKESKLRFGFVFCFGALQVE